MSVPELSYLLSSAPPPFIYLNDGIQPRITAQSVKKTLLKSEGTSLRFAHLNAVACFSPRVFYDTVLNQLAEWTPQWSDGAENWAGEGAHQRWNENVDGFAHGLRAIHASIGKGNQKEGTWQAGLVIVVERAEKLKDSMPDLIVPLTRLSELAQVPVTVVFISCVRWEDIKPALGASPDPYFIDVPPPDKQSTVAHLCSTFRSLSSAPSASVSAYHPALERLYEHFISVIYDTCSTSTQDPDEIAYVASAQWPGFVQPVLDQYFAELRERPETIFGTPTEHVRMRLIALLTSSLNTALEALHPRLSNAFDWAVDHAPPENLLSLPPTRLPKQAPLAPANGVFDVMDFLPRISRFILVASYLASTNPAKSDLRMFGRGRDERNGKRKKGGGTRKTAAKGGTSKVPQRLLGPAPFPLDRMIAILGVLLEEYDADNRPAAIEFTVPGEQTDMEIGRVEIFATVMELTSMTLLHRTSAPDKIDGPPTFKCGISYDMADALAKRVGIKEMHTLIWD